MFSLTKAILALFLAIKAVALPISGDTLTPTDDWDGKTLKCEYQLRKLYITYRFDGRGFEPDQTAAILAIRKAGKKAGLMTGWDAHIYKETSPGELWVQFNLPLGAEVRLQRNLYKHFHHKINCVHIPRTKGYSETGQ